MKFKLPKGYKQLRLGQIVPRNFYYLYKHQFDLGDIDTANLKNWLEVKPIREFVVSDNVKLKNNQIRIIVLKNN